MGLTVVVEGRGRVVDEQRNRAVLSDAIVGVAVLIAAAVCAVVGRRERQRVTRHRLVRYVEFVDLARVEVNESLLDPVDEILTTRRGDRQDDRGIHRTARIGV